MKFQAMTVALLAAGTFAAPYPQESSDVSAAPKYEQPTSTQASYEQPTYVASQPTSAQSSYVQPTYSASPTEPASEQPTYSEKIEFEETFTAPTTDGDFVDEPTTAGDIVDEPNESNGNDMPVEWTNPDVKWYNPTTWFGEDADKKLEEGAEYVGEGVVAGVVGGVGFKIGEEIYNDIKEAYESS